MSVRELLQDDFSCILPVAFAKDMDSMFVISNIYESNGAVALAYEDELYEIAQRMNSNLYIIPSSIHEIIVIPEDMVDLKGCIPYINAIQPSKEDKLTSHIYFYDKATRTLSIFNREK